MKSLGLLATLLVLLSGCVSEPSTTSQHMIFSSKAITFARGDSVTTVSITHSCTCPFEWSSVIIKSDTVNWLGFPHDTTGDHHNISIITRPSLYPNDTNEARIAINSKNN